MSYTKNIGYIGSVSLLITSITGPGIVVIPAVFQTAGWLLPILCFIAIGLLTGCACLFLVEASSMFPGNARFERNVEFTVLVHQFYGRYWYYLTILILYGSLQSTNIASIVGSAQVFDNLFITFMGQTCGYGLMPVNGFYCVSSSGTGNSPFGDNLMLFTFGFLVSIAMIVPLTTVDINDNILLQLISCVYLVIFIFTLFFEGAVQGFHPEWLPAFAPDQSGTVGSVLFNFAMANEIPSWVNITHPKVSIHKSIWMAIAICGAFYVTTGILGGLSFKTSGDTNLLQAMFTSPALSPAGKTWMSIIYLFFPVMTYATSIPVAMLVVKMNFMAANICSYQWATFWAVWFPFLLCIPLQTGNTITTFGIWTSLTLQAICNFIAPFLIYLFMHRRNLVMAQSVLDELEFLDITAGIKKYDDEEDDFDYIYHLPFADPARIIRRDPFKKETESKIAKSKSIGQLSVASKHSIKVIRNMLDPHAGAAGLLNQHRRSRVAGNSSAFASGYHPSAQGSHLSLVAGGGGGLGASTSRMGSAANLGTMTGTAHFSSQGSASKNLGAPQAGGNRRGSHLGGTNLGSEGGGRRNIADMYSGRRRSAAGSAYGQSGTAQYSAYGDDDNLVQGSGAGGGEFVQPFRALPPWVTVYVRQRHVAMIGLVIMAILVLEVLITTVVEAFS